MKFASTALVVAVASASQAFAFAPLAAQQKSSALNGVLGKVTGQSSLDPAVIERYGALPYPEDKILAEYVWVDAVGNTRSKTRTLPAAKGKSVDKLPKWNFDGSSTDQAPGDDSEVILKPQRIFKDPFRPRSDGAPNILVMCDTYTPAGEPLPTNTRAFGEFVLALFAAVYLHRKKNKWSKLLFSALFIISVCATIFILFSHAYCFRFFFFVFIFYSVMTDRHRRPFLSREIFFLLAPRTKK